LPSLDDINLLLHLRNYNAPRTVINDTRLQQAGAALVF
jgi:hypothetical protein